MANKTSTYQLLSAAVAASAGVVYIDLPRNGEVVAVQMACDQTTAGSVGGAHWEVSLNGADTTNVNGAQMVLCAASIVGDQVSNLVAQNTGVTGVRIPVLAGQRIFLNCSIISTAPTAARCRAVIHVLDQ